jgi:multiple antibiotic resistance protein
LLIAVDVFGVLVAFARLTEGLDRRTVRWMVLQSAAAASAVALLFAALGLAVLRFLGVTVADFLIAGGILLFTIAISDIIKATKGLRRIDSDSRGVMPPGAPLICGPAVLTTVLVLTAEQGPIPTVAALLANIMLASIAFWLSRPLVASLGGTGCRTVSRITSLLLAAIAVRMVREGTLIIFSGSLISLF